ncbi:MAG: hypothetical protein A3J59_04110 [Candidatus Buchananbacteria bacterium RIFCSPHIGHO2_02_FULL_56_16]|uniref:Uncharacterized protein n=1 Tax=Candidatus Buchananbacteria bacterium RIFCSPHIGHO2_02_FULL_56_16 TaxID=1797542 RepID=A0A1G1YIA6_9BACT|nr:MAG: hypothetical protein A3J59_04110 [Candidatus Buchananbacteria bacterium RIFCSPHIGHO2_02_FULL_56_16]
MKISGSFHNQISIQEVALVGNWAAREEDLFRLATVVLTDEAPQKKLPAAYLFGHTPDQQESIISAGADLWLRRRVTYLFVCGGGPYYTPKDPARPLAYAGGIAWRDELVARGVDRSDVIELERPELSHTATEAIKLIERASEEGWQDAYIVTAPFHLLRAFASTVAAINDRYRNFRVWCRPGATLPWFDPVVTSQGKMADSRIGEGMDMEFDRLNRVYHNQWGLAPAGDCLNYLKRRHESAKAAGIL